MWTRGQIIGLAFAMLVVGLTGGGIGGYYYAKKGSIGVNSPAISTSDTANQQSVAKEEKPAATAEEQLAACLKAKWGETKYQAITANPSLASTDDKFDALPCYK